MAQFDVYRNPSKTSQKYYPYLLDIQSSYISEIATRIVIPLAYASSFGSEVMEGLTPKIVFNDEVLLLVTPQISSVPAKILKNPVGSLAHCKEPVINALDFAISSI